jgi:hypothetical protein
MFFRTIGGAVAVGALGAVVVSKVGPEVPADVLNKVVGADRSAAIDPAMLARISSGLSSGLYLVFDVVVVLSFAAVVASWFFPSGKLGAADDATPAQS